MLRTVCRFEWHEIIWKTVARSCRDALRHLSTPMLRCLHAPHHRPPFPPPPAHTHTDTPAPRTVLYIQHCSIKKRRCSWLNYRTRKKVWIQIPATVIMYRKDKTRAAGSKSLEFWEVSKKAGTRPTLTIKLTRPKSRNKIGGTSVPEIVSRYVRGESDERDNVYNTMPQLLH